MPETPNTSFIPRQGPVRHARQVGSRQVHLLSVFAYGIFIVALAATAGAFFYQRHMEKQLGVKVEELNQAIAGFNDADMNQVREFNTRLVQTRERIENSISVAAIFEALESATLQSVSFESLKLERKDDTGVELEVKMITDSFDSSLFQRGVLERSAVVESVVVEDLSLQEGEAVAGGVSFLAKISVPTTAVPNKPRNGAASTFNNLDVPISTSTANTASTSSEEAPEIFSEFDGGEEEPSLEDNQPSL
jgi:hypothetical protein